MIDPDQISAALSEVIANAIQATPAASGRIEVRAAHDPWSNQVVVTVTDEGTGMDEPALKRAFDPFFSSKPAGRRRGLGRSTALRGVEASGGSIRLESQLGKGTTTTMLLPAADVRVDGAGESGRPTLIVERREKPVPAATDVGVQEKTQSEQPAERG
jgi:signal transduction histidine kinase